MAWCSCAIPSNAHAKLLQKVNSHSLCLHPGRFNLFVSCLCGKISKRVICCQMAFPFPAQLALGFCRHPVWELSDIYPLGDTREGISICENTVHAKENERSCQILFFPDENSFEEPIEHRIRDARHGCKWSLVSYHSFGQRTSRMAFAGQRTYW